MQWVQNHFVISCKYPITSDELELEFSGSSRAELVHFNFWAETELSSARLETASDQKFGTFFLLGLTLHWPLQVPYPI